MGASQVVYFKIIPIGILGEDNTIYFTSTNNEENVENVKQLLSAKEWDQFNQEVNQMQPKALELVATELEQINKPWKTERDLHNAEPFEIELYEQSRKRELLKRQAEVMHIMQKVKHISPTQLEEMIGKTKKRILAVRVLNDLKMLDSAVDQYAINNDISSGKLIPFKDFRAYLNKDTQLFNSEGKDPLDNYYNNGKFIVGQIPKVNPGTFDALSDVADASFWSPYK
jgi:hypothetical protein